MPDFTVTECTVSRSILTFEDTIDIRLTVKNTTGVKLTKCGLNLYFTNADRGISGTGSWVPRAVEQSSVSWLNNAVMTFNYSLTPDAIMSQPGYAGIYASLRTRISNVRSLPFRIELVATAYDGSEPSLAYTIEGVQYIDKYYSPQITLDAWRYPDDEATVLAATMKVELAEGNNASGFNAVMHYAQDEKVTMASPVLEMNVSRDILFGVGYSSNASVLPGNYVNGSVYSFMLMVSDGIETASAVCVVDRAFANMHLSGQRTGGVAIGKFSASAYGYPLFECAFPIVLSGSRTYGPSSAMPSNPVEGQMYFVVE